MVKLVTLFLGLSLVLTIISGHVAVKKAENSGADLLGFERIEDDGRRLPSEEEGLLKERKVREANAAQLEKSSKKVLDKRRKLHQKDRKESNKGKIGGFSERKTVKSKRKQKAAKNKNGKGVKKNKKRKSDRNGRKNKIKSKLQQSEKKKLKKRKSKKEKRRSKKEKKKSKNEKSKSKKEKKKSQKERIQNDKRNSSCLSTDCVDLAVSINELMRFKVSNFQKQVKRILKKREIGSKKSSKNSVFKSALSRLAVSGGNMSDPVCSGSTGNTGAQQITNLSETLTTCEANITALCDPSNMPEVNLTFIESCEVSIVAFEAFISKCSALSGAEACSCWSDSNSTALIDAVKQCDLGDLPKETRYALEDCKSAFGKCRKYEDDVAAALYACDQDPNVLKKKLKNLSENKAAVTQVQTKISSLINRMRREKREDDASTSAGFISLCLKVTSLIAQNPSSYLIYIYSTSILASTVTSFSAADLSSLTSISVQMTVAVTVLDAEISVASSTILGISCLN